MTAVDELRDTPLGAAAQGKPLRVLVSIFAFNEGDRIRNTLSRFPPTRSYDVLVVDDGSSDGSTEDVPKYGFELLRNDRNLGLGASIRRAFAHALQQEYDALVIMAGNGKDDPEEIDRLLGPLRADQADFVQGSRFLNGGQHRNMPLYRVVATRIHPLLFSLLSGTFVTESTNGFRALRTSILRDKRINWHQSWLDDYELEQYMHYKVVRLGYRRAEVPVSKIYPTGPDYTKVKSFSGWWSMLKPLLYLALRVKR